MKKISYCRWLYFIFLLAFILLFSITSLALIPGDFGSANGGPPDGVVDFEDLMIFAMAYGSTSSDANWNGACDIAGPNGSTAPNGVIDFEDLMIFAMHYGERESSVHNLTKDTYYNTIRAALDDADNDNIIEVFDGTYDESIAFPFGKLIVLRSVNGPSSTIIRGNDGLNTVTFNSSPEGTILEGFTITHADGLLGRGIYNNGLLTIKDCIISDNMDHDEYLYNSFGGGIYNYVGTLTIIGSTISGNFSPRGGGISSWGEITISESIISDNTAVYCGGSIQCLGVTTITGCTISGNSTSANNEGGGIWCFGAIIINESTISCNIGSHGAGIYNGGILTINSSIISDNDTSEWFSPRGGGILSLGTLTINDSIISGNIGGGHGGGIDSYGDLITINNSTITDNYADYGGGITLHGSSLTISGSNISNNSGGGIYFNPVSRDDVMLNITGSFISNNYSDWTNYYGIYMYNTSIPFENLIIGGNNTNEKNTICGNYKIGDSPSLDKQIGDVIYGNLYEIYKDTNYISADCTVIPDETVYRAFLVGVGDYVEDTYDLPEPPYDVDRMDYILNQCSFGPSNTQFSVISTLKDLSATKSAILQGIASVFSGSDDNDISYFYFSGHGYLDSGTNISYLCPTDTTLVLDLSTMISIDELETALSAIPGTKVVFIGACHSGGFIGKGEGEVKTSKEELGSFNEEIINTFSQAQSKGLLTTNQYQILTSCRSDQISGGWEDPSVVESPFGIFDMALCEGGGYFGNYPADTNLDNKVSLNEAYLYVIDWVNDFFEGLPPLDDLQDVQVYPNNSTFAIIEY